eukprot:CAMPEP_0201966522 /NCGR_PEP_ID=MMETSP0904-20121228/11472_1 /ASSEMBLY_ACC=CAM_ASM_000553 /TAXON_ID=420261 /ORGANISM="Thalassiosira antarctica, Strain CCMP982" /LENGTH=30 /DNA_ID= /DNA_START= /DNA_END= /DNA_ORIENTATION=
MTTYERRYEPSNDETTSRPLPASLHHDLDS